MITHYLKSAIKSIDDIIQFTKDDIEDIKKANNNRIFKRTKLKEESVNAFENKKSLLDSELVKIISLQENKGKELSSLLTKEQNELLEELKEKLVLLQKLNKDYAKMVVVVSEFYNSLLDRLFPSELDGYNKTNPKPASLLKVRA